MLFSFFFFKQKTAYEMRISDWSSDVCSSDLMHSDHSRMLANIVSFCSSTCTRTANSASQTIRKNTTNLMGTNSGFSLRAKLLVEQIGRASCRERVCQYV